MAEPKTLMTADQLLWMSLPDDELVELSEGQLIRRPVEGMQHGLLTANLPCTLADFVDRYKLGVVVGPNTGFQLDKQTVRAPDVGFVAQARIAEVGIPVGFWPAAPDLAVEVVSANDSAVYLHKKIQECFLAGTRLIWVVYPELKKVHVYRSPKEIRVLEAHDLLSGEDALPGFSVAVEEFFKQP